MKAPNAAEKKSVTSCQKKFGRLWADLVLLKYYWWCDLVKDLEASIPSRTRNTHEYVFLGSIPVEAIVVYIKYERHRLHNLKDAINEMVEDEGKVALLLVVDSNSGILRGCCRGCVPDADF